MLGPGKESEIHTNRTLLRTAGLGRNYLVCRLLTCLLLSLLLFPRGTMAEDAKQLLAEADRLAWLGNSDKAGALYAKAEELSSFVGDARNGLYARVGRLHAQRQANSLPELSAVLEPQTP